MLGGRLPMDVCYLVGSNGEFDYSRKTVFHLFLLYNKIAR
jgi:hypothetical protein